MTRAGWQRLESLGVDVEELRRRRRTFARPCLGWTERRPHLAGALGAGIAERLFELGWIRFRSRAPGDEGLKGSSA